MGVSGLVSLKCFHGTSLDNAQSILTENHFRHSDADSLRMGIGAYFFCQCGDNEAYAVRCAKQLEMYHINKGKHTGGYAILSCTVECDEENYMDLCDPEKMEYFHQMRYILLNRDLKTDPLHKYRNAAVADTQVFDAIRDMRKLSVIRCPQFFGMLEEEKKFVFNKGEHQYPKTYVPNVIMACVDTDSAIVKNIEIFEEGRCQNGYEGIVG